MRSSKTQEILTRLVILYMEQKLVQDLNYDDMIVKSQKEKAPKLEYEHR